MLKKDVIYSNSKHKKESCLYFQVSSSENFPRFTFFHKPRQEFFEVSKITGSSEEDVMLEVIKYKKMSLIEILMFFIGKSSSISNIKRRSFSL